MTNMGSLKEGVVSLMGHMQESRNDLKRRIIGTTEAF